MRRFLVLIAFIGRLAGQSYVWTARPLPRPVPMERRLGETETTREPWWLP